MSKANHTLGPWIATEYERQHVIIIHSGAGDEVASIDTAAMPDAVADAALMAAAPDLLAACEAFSDVGANPADSGRFLDALALARAAIKKARGGA